MAGRYNSGMMIPEQTWNKFIDIVDLNLGPVSATECKILISRILLMKLFFINVMQTHIQIKVNNPPHLAFIQLELGLKS